MAYDLKDNLRGADISEVQPLFRFQEGNEVAASDTDGTTGRVALQNALDALELGRLSHAAMAGEQPGDVLVSAQRDAGGQAGLEVVALQLVFQFVLPVDVETVFGKKDGDLIMGIELHLRM